MPPGPRLDPPDALHHVMVGGAEGRPTFRDDQDPEDLLRRLGESIGATHVPVYA